MNSCAQPSRRIASNLLWTAEGIIRHPLVETDAEGRLRVVGTCPQPDRLPFAEFYAGLLVAGFPADYRAAFASLMIRRETPLPELLAGLSGAEAVPETGTEADIRTDWPVADGSGLRFPILLPAGCLAVLSGLEYDPLRLTVRSQIRSIGIFR